MGTLKPLAKKKPKGPARITPLLKKRVEMLKGSEYEMTEEIFERATECQAVFDRVLVWQVPADWYGGKFFKGTQIEKPQSTQTRQAQDTPRGIIISAGLNALNVLHSQGMDIGHVVHFCVNSCYRRPLDDHDTKHLALLRVGDLVDSEDLADALDSGLCKIIRNDSGDYCLVDNDGNQWEPKLPWIES